VRRALAFVLVTLAAPAASANPVDAFGFGARGPAMGGAQTAASDDGGANYYNPAALARVPELRIDVGYQIAEPHLSINGGDQNVDASRGFALSLSAPGKIFGHDVFLGTAVFLPDERLTRVRTVPAQEPRWQMYDNRPQCLFLGTNLAIALGRRWLVGGGLAYMSRAVGALDLTGRVGLPVAEDSDLALDIDFDTIAVNYLQAGVLFHATPFLDLGASYRGEFDFDFEQKFSIHGDIGSAGAPPAVANAFFALDSVALDLFQPQQWSVGFALQLTHRLLLAGDLTWSRWSRFENPSAKIKLDYDLGSFNDMVHIPPSPPLPGPFFHDVVTSRLGLEWRAAHTAHTTWRVRAGYAYEPSPAPEQRFESNFVDNDKHTFSAGLGVAVARVTDVLPLPFDLDFYAAASVLPEREHRKYSPVDAVGDYVSKGFVLQLGLGSRWHF
jgi:long-chain fatty acid transport protein